MEGLEREQGMNFLMSRRAGHRCLQTLLFPFYARIGPDSVSAGFKGSSSSTTDLPTLGSRLAPGPRMTSLRESRAKTQLTSWWLDWREA